MHTSVLTVAPLRISFVGGGSDIKTFFKFQSGAVVSCAINKYVFVHVKIHDDSFGERYRISYSKVEHVQDIFEIENEIVRGCLEFMKFHYPVQISTLSDLPAGTGLGSSSSFTVALLLALHQLKGQHPTKHQLAEEASHVEIELLGHPIGKQDQYAATFGGLNFFRFKQDDMVLVEPVCISSNGVSELLERCRLFWTSSERSASMVLSDQANRASANFDYLSKMALLAQEFKDALEQEVIDWGLLASFMNESWSLKQQLSPLIATKKISDLINSIKARPDYASKLLGAGAGGFVLSFNGGNWVSPPRDFNLDQFPSSFVPKLDHLGARVISTF